MYASTVDDLKRLIRAAEEAHTHANLHTHRQHHGDSHGHVNTSNKTYPIAQ